jgi:hypothetical protein
MRSAPVAVSVFTLLLAATVVSAEEAKPPVNAITIMSIVAAPVDVRRHGYDALLKDPAPVAASDSMTGELLADGSVRYGRTVITVRNPCPPSEHLLLPGRR